MHTVAAKAVCFKEAMNDDFRQYAENIVKNCRQLASELINRGWRLVTGGTDSHLLLVDLSPRKLTGKEAAELLQSVHITANKNLIPFDKETPSHTSGLRLGTPALTTRGMGPEEMNVVAGLISDTLLQKDNPKVLNDNRHIVAELCQKFPLYRTGKCGK